MSQPAIATVLTERAPPPAGHYVQATVWHGLIFASGQLPVAPDGNHDPAAAFEDQARRALANLAAVIETAGGALGSVVKVTAYIAGVENWPRFDAVYAEVFGAARPARCVVPVQELHHGYLVEVEAMAAVGRSPDRETAA